MTVANVVLILALLVSMIINYVLSDKLKKAYRKLGDMENERRW